MKPDTLVAPIVRIILRYGAGALVAIGLVSPDTGPEVVADADLTTVLTVVVGVVLSLIAERWYASAKRTGGPT